MSAARESLGRVLAIARKELSHVRRDRITLAMIVGFPLVATMIFGLAINQDVRHLSAGVADLAGTQRARQFALDAQASQVVDLKYSVHSAEELEALIRLLDATSGRHRARVSQGAIEQAGIGELVPQPGLEPAVIPMPYAHGGVVV